jgi:hypothetical protein
MGYDGCATKNIWDIFNTRGRASNREASPHYTVGTETCTKTSIKGPDNPTWQLLPIMSSKCCSGDGERRREGKTKDVVEDRQVKQSCVCDKVVCERWCVTKKDGVCVCV